MRLHREFSRVYGTYSRIKINRTEKRKIFMKNRRNGGKRRDRAGWPRFLLYESFAYRTRGAQRTADGVEWSLSGLGVVGALCPPSLPFSLYPSGGPAPFFSPPSSLTPIPSPPPAPPTLVGVGGHKPTVVAPAHFLHLHPPPSSSSIFPSRKNLGLFCPFTGPPPAPSPTWFFVL